MKKLRILVFLRGYLPGYRFGGPLQSIANLVDRLGDEFQFDIVTADRDFGSDTPYPTAAPYTWVEVGRARVLYLAPGERRLSVIARILRNTPHDALYLNSFFDPHFTTLPLIARKLRLAPKRSGIILAPRGEFAASALQIKSTKKRLFLSLAALGRVHRNLIWQASTSREAGDIQRTIGTHNVHCAIDLPRRPAPLVITQKRTLDEPLRIVFLSRISPMKNLLFALQVLAQVKAKVNFTIHGPKEDIDYWQQCSDTIAKLPANVVVVDGGPVEPVNVVEALAQHDMFFLPTLGENYGHVIGEALEAGLQILISDRTPWRGLAEVAVGHDLPLDKPTAFVRAIEYAAAKNDRMEAAKRSYEFLSKAFDVREAIAANRHLLTLATSEAMR